MKKLVIAGLMFSSLSVQAEFIINPDDRARLGVGGYARFFTGKMESYQYNNAMKTEPYAKVYFDINKDLTLSGKLAVRYILDDRFPSKNKFKIYDAYVTVNSKKIGQIDAGNIRNVAYLMHQGPKDVGLFDIDDSDIYLFYSTPKGFFAPTLTYLNTDSRDTKISYTTPSLSGFKWGFSAVQSEDKKPDSCTTGGIKMDHGKGVITSAQYVKDFPLMHIGLSAGFAYYHDDRYFFPLYQKDASHTEYSLGMNMEKNNYSIGASYRQLMFPDKLNINDSKVWTAGVAYDDGIYGISLSYLHSRAQFIQKNTLTHIMLSGKYQINKYIKTVLSTGQMAFISNAFPKKDSWFGILGVELRL